MDFLSQPGLALYAIPFLYMTAWYPHVAKVKIIQNITNKINFVNPREFLSDCRRDKVPEDTMDRLRRMYNAHLNGLEGFSLWATSLFSAVIFGVDPKTTNTVALMLVFGRLLYNYLYFNGSSVTLGFMRSVLWTALTISSLTLLVITAKLVHESPTPVHRFATPGMSRNGTAVWT